MNRNQAARWYKVDGSGMPKAAGVMASVSTESEPSFDSSAVCIDSTGYCIMTTNAAVNGLSVLDDFIDLQLERGYHVYRVTQTCTTSYVMNAAGQEQMTTLTPRADG